jgi:anti-anti-sigma regulatory factor
LLIRPVYPRPLPVRVEPDRDKPEGELDLAAAAELRERVQELLRAGFEHWVVDLRGLPLWMLLD